MLSRDMIEACLSGIPGPDGTTPLTATGTLSDIAIREPGHVVFSFAIPGSEVGAWTPVRAAAEAAVRSIAGVTGTSITLTAQRAGAEASTPGAPSPPSSVQPRLAGLAQVRHVIAVASGKGGVGKSTTACNLALALRALGLRVGVLDADIYGPSMPKLFALSGQLEIVSGKTLRPLEAYGCKVMSIGFVVDADKAMVWRGPMVASAITQMLRDVAWGPLDVLVVDMPPGTGDAQLTMAQQTPLAGAVIVSTPQDLALIDARRGVAMFRNVGVPILGIIENMSYFICDGCGKRHDIFAHGGARSEAARLGVPFLGEIPLDGDIRRSSDAGLPIVVTDPDGPHAAAYLAIAKAVRAAVLAG
jgi:ATP-binding protein involved in chromosome partitioning